MKTTLVLTAMLLTTFTLAASPVASADHCATQPAVAEVRCQANHAIEPGTGLVNCLHNTAPNAWFVECIVL